MFKGNMDLPGGIRLPHRIENDNRLPLRVMKQIKGLILGFCRIRRQSPAQKLHVFMDRDLDTEHGNIILLDHRRGRCICAAVGIVNEHPGIFRLLPLCPEGSIPGEVNLGTWGIIFSASVLYSIPARKDPAAFFGDIARDNYIRGYGRVNGHGGRKAGNRVRQRIPETQDPWPSGRIQLPEGVKHYYVLFTVIGQRVSGQVFNRLRFQIRRPALENQFSAFGQF